MRPAHRITTKHVWSGLEDCDRDTLTLIQHTFDLVQAGWTTCCGLGGWFHSRDTDVADPKAHLILIGFGYMALVTVNWMSTMRETHVVNTSTVLIPCLNGGGIRNLSCRPHFKVSDHWRWRSPKQVNHISCDLDIWCACRFVCSEFSHTTRIF